MRKILVVVVPLILVGCASKPIPTAIPMPAPLPEKKCIVIPGKGCQQINAGNVGGTTLGNHNENILEENSR